MKSAPQPRPRTVEVAILAGGLSTRMGVDKSKVRIEGQRMLTMIRATASELALPVRVIRRDAVPRCGPLGGIMTGLSKARARAVLFLACDMPLVSAALLQRLLRSSKGGVRAVFCGQETRLGFPLLLPHSALAKVRSQIDRRAFSIQDLARALDAKALQVPAGSAELLNVNTPREKLEAERWLRRRRARAKKQEPSLVTSMLTPYGARP